MKKNGLRIDANYTEDVVGFALESFLTLLGFPRQRFTIEPFSRAQERWLGADGRLHSEIRGFRPFYMQFKRPAAYPDISTSKIIRDRRKAGLSIAPRALYFPLRQKQESHRDFQHNVLFRLREKLLHRDLGDAAYVCPLFLDRSAYRLNLHWSGLTRWPRFWRHHPWEWEDFLLEDGGRTARFERIPVLAEHITVPPHKRITSAAHSYSFTEQGAELCFHSPQALPDGSMSLAVFLGKLVNGFLRGEKLYPDRSDKTLAELIGAVYGDSGEDTPRYLLEGDDPLGHWFGWGDHLRTHYGIEQYALVRWGEGLPELL